MFMTVVHAYSVGDYFKLYSMCMLMVRVGGGTNLK